MNDLGIERQTVNAAVVCHRGCVRENNEDDFLFNGDRMLLEEMDQGAVISHTFTDPCLLFAVMDGMGGGDLGERASSIAAEMLGETMKRLPNEEPAACIDDAVRKINRVVLEDCRTHGADFEGTTLALLAIKDGRVCVSNVGDSRVYRMRNGQMEQMTEDHSTVWASYRSGQMTLEEARKSPYNNMITRYLGMNEKDVPKDFVNHAQGPLAAGDRYMLCSDGLSDMMSNETIAQWMRREKTPLSCAKALTRAALEEGGKDNVTCIVVDIGPRQAVPEARSQPAAADAGR